MKLSGPLIKIHNICIYYSTSVIVPFDLYHGLLSDSYNA